MAGMEFEYDEQGGTFYYFLLSFLALVLIPVTYYLWPREQQKVDKEKLKKDCKCPPCEIKKDKLRNSKPWKNVKEYLIKAVILLGWVFFVYVAYRASLVELDLTDFDPYGELEIDRGATDKEIKKAWRRLSLVYHPDRETGDPKKFMRISKAYKALTNEEARKNWEEYGNPDGPGATHFGIALPKWIVEKQNSMWVLAVYGLVFMVILPVAVGSWWYRSIKFSAEQILMDTMQLYRFFIHKTPNMICRRVIMILAASFEFAKTHNNDIVIRPSDNEEVPMLMKEVPHLQEKSKEAPLGYPYSLKARTLLHAHFSRIDVNPKTLEIDKNYVLKKCPYLINEMINIAAMLVAMGHAGRVAKMPRLDTVENMMRLSQMVIQAVWDNKSSLLQLPHIREDMLRHFVTRKRNIRTLQQFVKMKDEDRSSMLRLSSEEYRDVMNVCAQMPHVTMDHNVIVLDDEDSNVITAGSIVTVKVKLRRENMSVLFDKDIAQQIMDNPSVEEPQSIEFEEVDEDEDDNEENEEESKDDKDDDSQKKPSTKVWEKQKKKKGKGGKKPKKPVKQQHFVKKAPQTVTPAITAGDEAKSGGDAINESPQSSPIHQRNKSKSQRKSKENDDEVSTDNESLSENEDNDSEDAEELANLDDDMRDDDVEEDDWLDYDDAKKENSLETKSKETHEVHCPYFPSIKYEWWWLYVADKKNHSLITAPVQLCSLKDEEEVQLKFSAPGKPGKYKYNVILRSDSYFMDFDQVKTFDMEVKEAKKVETHPQWEEVPSDEDEDKDASDTDASSDDESEED